MGCASPPGAGQALIAGRGCCQPGEGSVGHGELLHGARRFRTLVPWLLRLGSAFARGLCLVGPCPALAQLSCPPTWLCLSAFGSREIGNCSGLLGDERGGGDGRSLRSRSWKGSSPAWHLPATLISFNQKKNEY